MVQFHQHNFSAKNSRHCDSSLAGHDERDHDALPGLAAEIMLAPGAVGNYANGKSCNDVA